MGSDYQIIIIGGGISGLSTANRLVDLGVKPILIEGGTYPKQRICGEFFSYECHPILEEWGIKITHPIEICRFVKGKEHYDFHLPIPGGSFPRFTLEEKLLERARSKGAIIHTETEVKSWKEGQVVLKSGEVLKGEKLIIGTGRLDTFIPKYYGYKAHLHNIDLGNILEMHCIEGGYFGINQIEEGVTNIAFLTTSPIDPNRYFDENWFAPISQRISRQVRQDVAPDSSTNIREHCSGDKARMFGDEDGVTDCLNCQRSFEKWGLEGRVPEFGIRKNPYVPNVFWVGDAMGSIPPASGDGLAIAITSGWMVAEFATKGDNIQYHQEWVKKYQKRFQWAKALHHYLLHPYFPRTVRGLCSLFPSIPQKIFAMTRG